MQEIYYEAYPTMGSRSGYIKALRSLELHLGGSGECYMSTYLTTDANFRYRRKENNQIRHQLKFASTYSLY